MMAETIRTMIYYAIRRLWLFARLVWRVDDSLTGHRMPWHTAWEVAEIVWPSDPKQQARETALREALAELAELEVK